VVEVFEKVMRGVRWDQAARQQFGGQGSYGNGAAMRVAPVALWAYPDIDRAVQLAEETARVTHMHPVGVEGAVIQAVAACHALASEPSLPFDTELLLADLGNRVHTDQFRARLEILPSCLERNDDERARLHLGNWVNADRSVVTALYCFLMSTDFTDAIVRGLLMGGDTDHRRHDRSIGRRPLRYGWHPLTMAAGGSSDVLLSLADAIYDRALHQPDPEP